MSTDEKDTAPQKENEDIKKDDAAGSAAEKQPDEKAEEKKDVTEDSAPKSEEKKSGDKKDSKKSSKKKDSREPKKTEEKKEEDAPAKELAALNDKFLRICAEYDNFRRRSAKEKSELYADIKSDTVKAFLPVYDNLERALKTETKDEAYAKGVELIMAQFTKTLKQLGVTPIDDIGKKFDPNLHNAVMHVDDEEKGENEIVEVFQKGFKLDEKVIRFSMVKVAN